MSDYPIGKRYDGGTVIVQPEHAAAYAAATNDHSAAYTGPDAIAPPMFHVRLIKDTMFQVAGDPELGLDMLRLVHGEHDATFHRPLRPGDEVAVEGRLEAVTEKSSGLLVVSRHSGTVDGQLAFEAKTAYFIRAKRKPSGSRPKRKPPEPPPTPEQSVSWSVDADQSHRYAEASLDRNGIHIDREVATNAGLPDVILHGLCSMAMAGVSLTDTVGGGDPGNLKRLSVRFSGMVFNGDTLTTHLWPSGTFAVTNEAGKPVITGGVAEFSNV
ncbi:MAG: acyl dehydratase [Myxococcota bacterium]|jgi:acyl dehydratase